MGRGGLKAHNSLQMHEDFLRGKNEGYIKGEGYKFQKNFKPGDIYLRGKHTKNDLISCFL